MQKLRQYFYVFDICFSFLVFNFLFCFVSCSPPMPTSIGGLRNIILMTDYQKDIEPIINNMLQQNIYTVQPEPEFIIKYRPLGRINDFLKFHLIFIIGTINEEPIQILLNNQIDKINSDTFGLFVFSEPWSKNQKVVVFAVKSSEDLATGLTRYSERIRKAFQEYLLTHMTRITYERGYNKKISEIVLKKYNINFKVPNGFNLVEKYEKDNFIYFVTHNPDRTVFFYSTPYEMNLNPDDLITFRDTLTQKYYDGDLVYQPYTRAETTSYNNVCSIKLIGVWQNSNLKIGGPFISYCFNYKNKFYFIDGMLFYPGKKKLDNLNQLDAIINSFAFTDKK